MTKEKQPMNVNEIEVGDIFSEESHYRFIAKDAKGGYQFTHLESGETVTLDEKYVNDFLITGDQYSKETEVTKEEIHSIWDAIYSSQVFTVSYTKQGSTLSDKAIKMARDKQLSEVLAKLNAPTPALAVKRGRGRPSKASLLQAATQVMTVEKALREIQNNPIVSQPGEERILCGYKTQFTSTNGLYEVFDMEIAEGSAIMTVNINTVNWLVFGGVKYIVK
jgi:hypothetical protein